jgi:type II secretory pathway pseudopilin PulG
MPTNHRHQRNPIADRLHLLRERAGTDDGVILAEILVSMLIFAVVAAGASSAIMGGISASSITQNRVSTANVAQQSLQQARNLSPDQLAATPTATSTASVGAGTYTITRTVTFTPAGSTACPTAIASGTPHSALIHVSVSGTGEHARTVAMDTVIAC